MLLVASPGPAAEDLRVRYRADALGPIPSGTPTDLELLFPPGIEEWPEAARQALTERVREEWPAKGKSYGTVQSGVGVWLDYPLVTTRVGGRVVLPVLPEARLPIAGELALPASERPRRVVLLVDASSSANALTRIQNPDGSVESVSVLEAERRALDHLIELLDDDWLEFGLIAFGEGTWPIVEPGASSSSVREALARFRAEHPEGEGRTDLVCALWLAREWLSSTPSGVTREIYVLTDGDLPHSGRFLDCSRGRGREAKASCEAQRNATACPAEMRYTAGRSDLVQLESFARRVRRELRIYPLVFEPDRSARAHQMLARETGGELVRAASVQAIDAVLPALVARRIHGVYAVNLRTGERTPDLSLPDGARFAGELPLLSGANDVELRVESDRGTAALFRFRIYAVPDYLERYLADLRNRNHDLEVRVDDLVGEARTQTHARRKRLTLEPEVPASTP